MKSLWLRLALAVALPLALTACMPRNEPGAGVPDAAHNSRNSLDWAGTYEGIMPCADCPGIRMRLSLHEEGSYELSRTYLERSVTPSVERGKFEWQPGGNAIKLQSGGIGQQFAVGEGRLAWIEPGAASVWPSSARYVLTKVASKAASKAASDLKSTLESHRWTADAAFDGQGQPIVGLAANGARTVVFHFAGGRLNVEGGCNRSFGSYQIDADGRLKVGRMASTMMACDPAAMKIDDKLAALLAEPVAIELARGDPPTLRLVSPHAGTLSLSGQLTPEARYGAATRVFLEVAPQTVACNNPLTGAATCFQVRERVFDDKGLAVNPPGAWRPMHESIEGYTHQPGVRNVLRLKRFQRGAGGGYVYVLDLIVESETVAR